MVKNILVYFILFLGRNTILGRGSLLRKQFLKLLDFLIGNNKFTTVVDNVRINYYFDGYSDTKSIMGGYNSKELDFLINNMKKDGIFLDIGANYGFFTQNIATKLNFFKKIIAIEPNKLMVQRINENIKLLDSIKIDKIKVENVGIAEEKGEAYLDFSNGYGNAMIVNKKKSDKCMPVSLDTLKNILNKNNVSKIDCLKIDVEGYEDKVLLPFFKNSLKELYPKCVIMEHTSSKEWDSNIIYYMKYLGYKEVFKTRGNIALKLE